jgi:hypothetical protein
VDKTAPGATCESFDPQQAQNEKLTFRAGCKYTLVSCRVEIEPAGSLDIENGAELEIQEQSYIINQGSINVEGLVTNNGHIENTNLMTVSSQGNFKNSHVFKNLVTGAFFNQGQAFNSGDIVNEGASTEGSASGVPYGITNEGTFVNDNSGQIANSGSMTNNNVFENRGEVTNTRESS